MPRLTPFLRTAALPALGVLFAGFSAGTEAASPGPAIVTTILPVAWITQELAGPETRPSTLVPAGASPHTFEPLPSDLARLSGADLCVRLGPGADDWMARLLEASPPDLPVLSILQLDDIGLRTAPEGHGPDPHVWLDPIRVRDVIAPAITRELIRIDPAGEAAHRRRLTAFTDRLTRLDGDIRAILDSAPARRYVAFHDSWRYFAGRYDLEQVAVVQEFAGEEPAPGEVARLVDEARTAGVPAILVEPQLPDRLARAIALEFGGVTVTVDPLGDPTDPERSTYESLMRFNARAFARALGRESHSE